VIYWLYERMLERNLVLLPEQVCVMITGQDMQEAPEKILECTTWCIDISSAVSSRRTKLYGGETGGDKTAVTENTKIQGLTYHISTKDPLIVNEFLPVIRKISGIGRLNLHYGDHSEVSGDGFLVHVAVGKSGREEITDCIRQMARDRISPGKIDEKTLESYLTFKYTPDFVIKTGGDHLTDFLIWQSVYSELFFSDINWKYMRKVDFLRALRDYQARVRRFGR
jgi:undecaprenyl diphosphate synthase